jgi:hypothetical protein
MCIYFPVLPVVHSHEERQGIFKLTIKKNRQLGYY